MASRVCWFCGQFAHMALHGNVTAQKVDAGVTRVSGLFTCDSCHHPSLGMADERSFVAMQSSTADYNDWLQDLPSGSVIWSPPRGRGPKFSDVPDHVASAASEAYECQSIGAHRGAVALARSVVEATAKEKGITRGRLVEKIDQMHARGLIREYVKDGAHEVRHLGNDVAHGDFVDPVSQEEADLVLTLMSEVLDEVFQGPARVAKAQQVRLARQQQGQTASP